MKKLILFTLIISSVNVINVLAERQETDYGTGDEAKEKITILNQTEDRVICVGVYKEKGKEVTLFGDIYSLLPKDEASIFRPERSSGVDRNLYFAVKEPTEECSTYLKTSLAPTDELRTKKQFINVGSFAGSEFMIYPVDSKGNPTVKQGMVVGIKGAKKSDSIKKALNKSRLQ